MEPRMIPEPPLPAQFIAGGLMTVGLISLVVMTMKVANLGIRALRSNAESQTTSEDVSKTPNVRHIATGQALSG